MSYALGYSAYGDIPSEGATGTVIPCPTGFHPSICGPCILNGKPDDPTCGSGPEPTTAHSDSGTVRYGGSQDDGSDTTSASDAGGDDTSEAPSDETSSADDGSDQSSYDDGSDGGDGSTSGGGGGGSGGGGGGGGSYSPYYADDGSSGGAPSGASLGTIALGVGVVGLIGYFFFRSIS